MDSFFRPTSCVIIAWNNFEELWSSWLPSVMTGWPLLKQKVTVSVNKRSRWWKRLKDLDFIWVCCISVFLGLLFTNIIQLFGTRFFFEKCEQTSWAFLKYKPNLQNVIKKFFGSYVANMISTIAHRPFSWPSTDQWSVFKATKFCERDQSKSSSNSNDIELVKAIEF